MYIDSHCHLDRLDCSVADAVAAAREAQVSHMLCVAIDLDSTVAILDIIKHHKHIYGSVGIHPNEACAVSIETLLEHAGQDNKIIAIGETGLDFYRDNVEIQEQCQRFIQHIEAAKLTKKPLIIHTRDAREKTIEILKDNNASEVGGVLHCFTETLEMAEQAMDLGFYISISGIITFKNAKELQETVKKIPLSRLLIETDSPYLAPMPYRGKPNVPAYVPYVAKKIAELHQISVDEVAKTTSQNFFDLFNIKES